MFNNSSLQEDQHNRNVKSSFLVLIVGFIFLILVGRLFYLQVIMYDENLRLSESNRMRKIIIKANRGNIFSRNKEILVRNRVSNNIMIEPNKVEGLRGLRSVVFNKDSITDAFLKSEAYAERKTKFDGYLREWIEEVGDSVIYKTIPDAYVIEERRKLTTDSLYKVETIIRLFGDSTKVSFEKLHLKALLEKQSVSKKDSIYTLQKKRPGYEKRVAIYERKLKWFVKNSLWDFRMKLEQQKVKNLDLFHNLMTMKNVENKQVFDTLKTMERIHAASRKNRFKRHLLLEDVNYEVVSLVVEHQEHLQGVVVEYDPRRFYTSGKTAAHLLGYNSEITEEDLKDSLFANYRQGAYIGKSGVEKIYEPMFRGQDGIKFVEVDVYGRELGLLESMPNEKAKAGYNVVTTIDLDLQKIAEEAFADTLKGALVALNPQNGEILAMLSSPAFDPNIYSIETSLRNEAIAELKSADKPSYNRAALGTYPPGSLFKLFTSIAGMETKKITPTFKYRKACTGAFKFGRRVQKCWKASGHGRMDVVDALRESCDVYFYQLGLDVGMDPINKYARMYGLASKSGIDLPTERSGLLMDSTTYNKRFKHKGWRWTRGQILNLAIGQGELVTPLQMANAFGALAANDSLYHPHLLKEVVDENGLVVKRYKPKALNAIEISDETYNTIITAMEEVISAPHGTGGWSRVKGVRVGGKTGSAENPHGEKTHAWFAAVAPLDKPEIAIAVLVENAGHGGSIAAPIAGKVLRHYFSRKKKVTNDTQ
ncbi:MAG: penicillin-binding protein 2 [Fibrobacterales bacterium]